MTSNMLAIASSIAVAGLLLEGCGGSLRASNEIQLVEDGAEKDRALGKSCPCPEGMQYLRLDASLITHDNLAFEGPDSGEPFLILQDVIPGYQIDKVRTPIDIKIEVLNLDEGAGDDAPIYAVKPDFDKYRPHPTRSQDNTELKGNVIYINVNRKHKAKLQVSFVKSEDQTPVEIPGFHISVLDVDSSHTTLEDVTISGYKKLILPASPEFTFVETQTHSNNGKYSKTVNVVSAGIGSGWDNPRNPDQLKVVTRKGEVVDQAKRTFAVEFENTDQFTMTLSASGKGGASGGRNFAITGWSSLVDECDPPEAPAPPPPVCPSPTCETTKSFKNLEECTNSPLYAWMKNPGPDSKQKDEPDPDQFALEWDKKVMNSFSSDGCTAYVETKWKTCADYCGEQGKLCLRGMDDAHWQSNWLKEQDHTRTRCSVYPGGHHRVKKSGKKNVKLAGCDQKWETQFCACGCVTPETLMMSNSDKSCDKVGILTACNVGFSNPMQPKEPAFAVTQPMHLSFQGDACLSLELDDEGYLLVDSNGCSTPQVVQPAFVVTGMTVFLNEHFKFQVKQHYPSVQTTETLKSVGSFTLQPNRNYRLNFAATTNVYHK